MDEVSLQKNKVSFIALIFSISPMLIFFCLEGTFLIRSIYPLIFIICVYFIFTNREIYINRSIVLFGLLEIVYSISTFINMFIYNVENNVIVQMIYQASIFLWYSLVFQQKTFTKHEINIYMDVYIGVCLICSLYLLLKNLVLGQYTSSLINIFGYKIGKNFFGAFICLAPMYAFLKYIYGTHHKLLYLISSIIISIATLFTNSRATIIATGVGMALIYLRYFLNNFNLKRIVVTAVILFLVVVSIKPILGLIPQWMYKRYFIKSYVDTSNIDRVYLWKNALSGIAKSPVIGYGPGIFSLIPEFHKTELGRAISDITYSHNTYIDVMVNGGVIGCVCFIGMIVTSIKETFVKLPIFRPIIIAIIFTSFILGAGKSVYFWNGLIFIGLLSEYVKTNNDLNIIS